MRLCGRINSLTERNRCPQATHPRFTMAYQHFQMYSNLLYPSHPPFHRDADELAHFDESTVGFLQHTQLQFQYLPSSVDPEPCRLSVNPSVSCEQSWPLLYPYDSPSPSPLFLPSDVGLGPFAQPHLAMLIDAQDTFLPDCVNTCASLPLLHPTQLSLPGVQFQQDMVYHRGSLSSPDPHYMDGQFHSPDTYITPSALLSDDSAPTVPSSASDDQEWPCPHCDVVIRSRPSNLVAHIKEQHNPSFERHYCTQCPRSYKRSHDLRRHTKAHHPVSSTENAFSSDALYLTQ
ncbi:hypothetical protein C8Q74DRAFT_216917 [Fomes fomentarius]|nr:hypothetical protein C8Q74DRAFT_216917 [Fomes fomentarius]